MTLNEVRTISWISLGSVAFGTRGNVFRRLRRVEGLRRCRRVRLLGNRPLNVVTAIPHLYVGERFLG